MWNQGGNQIESQGLTRLEEGILGGRMEGRVGGRLGCRVVEVPYPQVTKLQCRGQRLVTVPDCEARVSNTLGIPYK